MCDVLLHSRNRLPRAVHSVLVRIGSYYDKMTTNISEVLLKQRASCSTHLLPASLACTHYKSYTNLLG